MGDYLDEILKDMDKMDEAIPEDKDCTKCNFAVDGHTRGMISPCFDYCMGHGLAAISLGEENDALMKEDIGVTCDCDICENQRRKEERSRDEQEKQEGSV